MGSVSYTLLYSVRCDVITSSPCRFPLLHERMEEIRAFRCLKSLDLFGCRLGDHHEIFQHVTSLPKSDSLLRPP